MFAGSYARQFVWDPEQTDYLTMSGNTDGRKRGRGGSANANIARMSRFDDLQPNPVLQNQAGKMWTHDFSRDVKENMGFVLRR